MSKKSKVPILTGFLTFKEWDFKLCAKLRMQQLIDIIFPFDEGNEKEKMIEGSSALIKKEHTDKEQWFQEQQALGIIQMSLDENHQRFAQGITKPKELYDKICAHYWHVEVNS